jgi:hypothetical protein
MSLRKWHAEHDLFPSDNLLRKEFVADADAARLKLGNSKVADSDGTGLHSQRKFPYLTGSPLLYASSLQKKVHAGKCQPAIPLDWVEAAALSSLTLLVLEDADELNVWTQLELEVERGEPILKHVKAVVHHRCHTQNFMCSSMLSVNLLRVQGRSMCSAFVLASPDEHNPDDVAVMCAICFVRFDWEYKGATACQKMAMMQRVDWESDPEEERVFGQPVMRFRMPQDCPVNEPPELTPIHMLSRPLILITPRKEEPEGFWRLIQYQGKGLGNMFTDTVAD